MCECVSKASTDRQTDRRLGYTREEEEEEGKQEEEEKGQMKEEEEETGK